MNPPPATDLQARYGKRRRPRWFWPVIAAVGISIGVAWSAWVAFQPRAVTAVLYGYDIVSDQEIVLTVELRRPEPVDVECSVYAQAFDHSIVGERTVTIEASETTVVRTEIALQTTERAVTGILRSCRPAQ